MRSFSLKWCKRSLGIFLLVFGAVVLAFFSRAYGDSLSGKKALEDQLVAALITNRARIEVFFSSFNEYPILENGQIHFWDVKTNQYIWLKKFDGLVNVATNPIAVDMRNHSWTIHEKANNSFRRPTDEDLKKMFNNPFTGQFDWLAESVDGKLYSPKTPREQLLASPPIRIKNVRCPQTASDPPFFEDFTKW